MLSVASFFAAAISGMAGFGGALVLMPLLVKMVGVEQAVPLLTVVQFVGNGSRVALGFSRICWKQTVIFLLGAVPSAIVGALLFIHIPKELVARGIGAIIILSVILHWTGKIQIKGGVLFLIAGGGLTGFLSGLAGSAGPLGAAIFLALGLPPVAYIASEAMTALTMHGIKMMLYHHYIRLTSDLWILAFLLGIVVIIGTWAAQWVTLWVPHEKFKKGVTVLLILIATYMLVHG